MKKSQHGLMNSEGCCKTCGRAYVNLRRRGYSLEGPYLTIPTRSVRSVIPGSRRRLPTIQMSILRILLKSLGEAVNSEFLISSVWGSQGGSIKTLNNSIRLLRQSLKGTGLRIENEHGFGFKIVPTLSGNETNMVAVPGRRLRGM